MLRAETHGQTLRVHVDGEMTIYNAELLKAALAEFIETDAPLEVDLSNVSEIDSAGVQLLMLLKKERHGHSRQLTLANHSSPVLDVFELMDLAAYFSDPIVLTRSQGDKHGS